jgi:tripartite-type tricarboxylate transporter receptor subunit TctC
MQCQRQPIHLVARVPVILALVSMLFVASGHVVCSQPTRTIKIVVPYTPGSPSDIMARLLAEEINRAQGPTMVVENRPGGSAAIGTEAVARAAPDGSTLLIATTAFVISPHLQKLSYDPLTSFEPICNLTVRPPSLSSAAHPPTSRSPILRRRALTARRLDGGGRRPASTVHIAF